MAEKHATTGSALRRKFTVRSLWARFEPHDGSATNRTLPGNRRPARRITLPTASPPGRVLWCQTVANRPPDPGCDPRSCFATFLSPPRRFARRDAGPLLRRARLWYVRAG